MLPLPTKSEVIELLPFLTKPELDELDWLLIEDKLSFLQFVSEIYSTRQWPDYALQLFDVLQLVANGELNRVMVFMPPRHFKSEIVSRLFSAYYLYCYPDRWVALCSYAAELAYTLSRNARENYQRIGRTLKDDAGAVKHWETGSDGGLWAAGVGGPATGKGFHLGLIDDPIKNSEEAQSFVIQRRNEDWYASTFSTRQEPDAAIVLIQTRWGIHDLAGYLLDKEKEEPEHWHIFNLEALKSDSPLKFPDTCTIEIDNRQVGEALNPERYPADKLAKIKRRIGPFFFNALYQQNPILRAGRVYHAFAGPGPDAADLDYSKASGYYHTHDFGAVNAVWCLWAKIGEVYYMIDEQKLPEGTTASRAEIIRARWEGLNIVAGYGGAKGEDQQRADFEAAGVEIRLPHITDVEAQINAANQMLEAGTMVICANCVHTIDQLENCVRDDKEGIADKASWHYLDAGPRYFAGGISGLGEIQAVMLGQW